MTFKNWLLNFSDYGKYGYLATNIESDSAFPNTGSYIEMLSYLIKIDAGETSKKLFQEAYNVYKNFGREDKMPNE